MLSACVQGVVQNITALATHPTKPQFILAGEAGRLQIWDLLTQSLLTSQKLSSPTTVTCLKYSHDGIVLAMGTSTGLVRICREADCELVADFRPVKQVRAAEDDIASAVLAITIASAMLPHSWILVQLQRRCASHEHIHWPGRWHVQRAGCELHSPSLRYHPKV